MKKIKLYLIAGVSFFVSQISAQVNSNGVIQNNVGSTNAFLDASTNFNTSASSSSNMGKGLVFPDTNLTTFGFDLQAADGVTFPSYFDGMVVYNTATGNTVTGQGVVTEVTPGFYYFSNPTGENNSSITAGKWLPLGGASANKTTTLSYTHAAGATAESTAIPVTGLTTNTSILSTKLYSVVAGKKTLVNANITDVRPTTTNVTFSNTTGQLSQVLANGTYELVLEHN